MVWEREAIIHAWELKGKEGAGPKFSWIGRQWYKRSTLISVNKILYINDICLRMSEIPHYQRFHGNHQWLNFNQPGPYDVTQEAPWRPPCGVRGVIQTRSQPRMLILTSIASRMAPAKRKKAAACSNRCRPSSANAFFSAARRHLSSLKLFLKNPIILESLTDLKRYSYTFSSFVLSAHMPHALIVMISTRVLNCTSKLYTIRTLNYA